MTTDLLRKSGRSGVRAQSPKEEQKEATIDGRHPKVAHAVREILRHNDSQERLSVRDAARKTGLSHATIANMARGDRPSAGLLIQFAQGMKADINDLLAAADYPLLEGAADRSLFEEFASVERFGLEPEYNQYADPRHPDYVEVMSKWTALGAAALTPLLPFTNRPYKRDVLRKYLSAQKSGDPIVQLLEARYRLIFKLCVHYTIALRRVMEAESFDQTPAEMAQWKWLYRGVEAMQRQNTLAMVAWYEAHSGDQSGPPDLPALSELIDMRAEGTDMLMNWMMDLLRIQDRSGNDSDQDLETALGPLP